MHPEPEFDLVVDKKEQLADGVAALTLRRNDGRDLPAWQPGAHVDLVLTDAVTRQYSLCGDPAERAVFQVAVLREPAGRGGSAHVHDTLAGGDTVRVRGPRNHFGFVAAPRYVFVAGGIGITPILPMIAAADATGAPWCLAYGGRTRASMAFRAELEARYGSRVRLHPADEVGLIDVRGILAAERRDGTAVYCCGPEPLLAAVERECAGRPELTLHVERFSPKPGAADGPQDAFEVRLSVSSRTVSVPAHRTILEMVREAGVQVLSSCEEGTCGTCETTVLDGVIDHRDSVLTDDDRAAGDTMMICVSRARSERLVLEL